MPITITRQPARNELVACGLMQLIQHHAFCPGDQHFVLKTFGAVKELALSMRYDTVCPDYCQSLRRLGYIFMFVEAYAARYNIIPPHIHYFSENLTLKGEALKVKWRRAKLRKLLTFF